MARTMTNISMMKSNILIFVDTSAHYALINKEDVDHQKAVTFLKELAREKAILICSNFIVSEVYTLIMRKIGRDKAIHYVQNLRESTRIERIFEEDEKQAWKIILKYQKQLYYE